MDSDDEMAARAVAAMEALGLPKKFVLGVLSRSLKAYDGAWGFLAQDHFQILADICFTEMETETVSIERGVSVKCAASNDSASRQAAPRRSKAESSSRTRALPAPRPAEVRAARTNVAAVRALPCSTALLPPPAPRPASRPTPPTAPMPAPKPVPPSRPCPAKPPVFKVPPSRPRPLQRSSPAHKNGNGTEELEPFILKAFNGISPFGDFPHHLLLPPPNGHEREPPPSHSRCRPLQVEPLAVNDELHLPLPVASTRTDANKQLAIVPQTADDTALAIVPQTAETISSPSFGVLALLSQYGDGGDN